MPNQVLDPKYYDLVVWFLGLGKLHEISWAYELTGGAAVLLEVVVLAEQGVVLAGLEVEHLARRELLAADGAGEAAQVVHLLPRLPHVVLRQDALPAPRALRPETPET